MHTKTMKAPYHNTFVIMGIAQRTSDGCYCNVINHHDMLEQI